MNEKKASILSKPMTKFYDFIALNVIDCEYIIIVLDYEFFSIIL